MNWLPPRPEDYPADLLDCRQYLVWRAEEKNGRITKVPYQPGDPRKHGSSTDRNTWGTLAEALSAYRNPKHNLDGIGIAMHAGLCGIDLDHCIDPETGEVAAWALELVRKCGTYAERSPSGHGIRIIGRAKLPGPGKKRGPREIYDAGRYLTLTGHRLDEAPATVNESPAMLEFYAQLVAEETAGRPATPERSASSPNHLSDHELIERIRRGKQCHLFDSLYAGDISGHPSQSDAEWAFLGLLAYWTGGDAHRMDRIYRGSRLFREKWDERRGAQTYGERTIAGILAKQTEFYDPSADEEPRTISFQHQQNGAAYTNGVSPQTNGAVPAEPVTIVEIGGTDNDAWPAALAPQAYHGPAGRFVDIIGEHTEADPAALLVQFLVAYGSAVGRRAYFQVEATRHYPNLFAAIVGATAKGRKGTSWAHIPALFKQVAPTWTPRIFSGLNSGEGLIFNVRDPVEKVEPIKEKGNVIDYQPVVADPGIKDKRLMIQEPELASALKMLSRDGNILGMVLRDAWDGNKLQTLTKNSPIKATGAHVSVVGHITRAELLKQMSSVEAFNGFANRFLWVCARRQRLLPEGGCLDPAVLDGFAHELRDALEFGYVVRQVRRDEAARAMWFGVYEELGRERPGMLGAVTARSEAQVTRLSLIYALLDRSPVVQVPHLLAALAVWQYAEESARHIFGDSLGDPVADEILSHLKRAYPEPMNRTQILALFNRHRTSAEVDSALTLLRRHELARGEIRKGRGRPVEWWCSTQGLSSLFALDAREPEALPQARNGALCA